MQRIRKKKLFRIEFDLASALAIGSGENLFTDKDVILGSDNKPYIPASAIAGVCISALDAANSPEERKYKDYWGYISKNDGNKNEKELNAIESRIVFYDAYLVPKEKAQNSITSVRDSVALDEYKTAIDGAKFDMEVVEPGVRFRTYVEQSFMSENEQDLGQAIAERFLKCNICFGSKTSRGYGSIDQVDVKYFELNFGDNSDENTKKIELWAGLSEDCDGDLESLRWEEYKNHSVVLDSESKNERQIKISLKQSGGISIRRYTTDVAKNENETVPDFTQLISSDVDAEGNQIMKPVIPGTSWAGAFIHQIEKNTGMKRTTKKVIEKEFVPNELDQIFGYVIGGKKQKSKISFGESLIEGATEKQLSRNAIDRFTGGTKDGALFTEKTYYGGTTALVIRISDNVQMSEPMARAFAAAIVDLHYGFMAVGGETSIGRGLFTITKMDGVDSIPKVTDTDSAAAFYDAVYKVIVGQEGGQKA